MTTQDNDQLLKYGNVGKSWRKTFESLDLLDAADHPSLASFSRSPKFRALSFWQRGRISFNFKAFIFGPFYYLFKGMWQKGLTICAAAFILSMSARIVLMSTNTPSEFTDQIPNIVALIMEGICATLANHDYYLHKTQNVKTWESIPIRHPAGIIITFIASIILFIYMEILQLQ